VAGIPKLQLATVSPDIEATGIWHALRSPAAAFYRFDFSALQSTRPNASGIVKMPNSGNLIGLQGAVGPGQVFAKSTAIIQACWRFRGLHAHTLPSPRCSATWTPPLRPYHQRENAGQLARREANSSFFFSTPRGYLSVGLHRWGIGSRVDQAMQWCLRPSEKKSHNHGLPRCSDPASGLVFGDFFPQWKCMHRGFIWQLNEPRNAGTLDATPMSSFGGRGPQLTLAT
jgi:hypothetical protein